MGQWENEMRNALSQYSNNTGNIYSGLTSRELGAIANAAWARQAQEEAERKRLLEVQKQKDEDAALERQYKLKKMQYELDDIENARNNKNLLNTLAPYKPSYGFDSDTGENITSGSIPLDPILQATMNAAGFNLANTDLTDPKSNMMKNALDKSLKAFGAESSNPEQYTKMTESERQKAIDDVLPPYEFSYNLRSMTPDVYKANKIYDRSIYNADTGLAKAQVGADAKVSVAGIKAKAQVDSANTKANAGIEQTNIKTKGKILGELIKYNSKNNTVELTNKLKEKLAKWKIDAKRFSEITSLYLKAYNDLKYDNPNETDVNIRHKAQAMLLDAGKVAEKELIKWRKDFIKIQNEPEETTKSTPQKDIKADAYDVLINN